MSFRNNGLNLLSESTDIQTLTQVVTTNNNITIANVQNLQAVLNTKADSSTVAANIATINSSLESKASTESLNTHILNTLTALDSTVRKTVFNSTVAGINTSLDSKANSQDVTTALATKQQKLIVNPTAAGVSIFDSSYNLRNIFGISPIEVLLYFDPLNANNTRNGQIQISIDLDAYATQTYVNTQINNLINGSPNLLNTLKELADALNNDPNFSATITTALASKQNIITASTNISLNNLTINGTLNGSALSSLTSGLQQSITVTAPLSMTNNVISINLTQYQPLLSTSSDLSIRSLVVYDGAGNEKGSITTGGQFLGKALSFTSLLETGTLTFGDDPIGFRYVYNNKLTGVNNITSSIITRSSGTVIKYNSNLLEVDSIGVNISSDLRCAGATYAKAINISTSELTAFTITNSTTSSIVVIINKDGLINTKGGISFQNNDTTTASIDKLGNITANNITVNGTISGLGIQNLNIFQPTLTSSSNISVASISIYSNNGLRLYNGSNIKATLDNNGDLTCNDITARNLSFEKINIKPAITQLGIASTLEYTDVVLSSSIASSNRYIRLESRTIKSLTGIHSIQFGLSDNPTLSIGDNYALVKNKLIVGPTANYNTTPSDTLTIIGSTAAYGLFKADTGINIYNNGSQYAVPLTINSYANNLIFYVDNSGLTYTNSLQVAGSGGLKIMNGSATNCSITQAGVINSVGLNTSTLSIYNGADVKATLNNNGDLTSNNITTNVLTSNSIKINANSTLLPFSIFNSSMTAVFTITEAGRMTNTGGIAAGQISIDSSPLNYSELVLLNAQANSGRRVRLESRELYSLTGPHSIQLGLPDNPTLSVGDNYALVKNKLIVGTPSNNNLAPTDVFSVIGSTALNGLVKAYNGMNIYNSTSQYSIPFTINSFANNLVYYVDNNGGTYANTLQLTGTGNSLMITSGATTTCSITQAGAISCTSLNINGATVTATRQYKETLALSYTVSTTITTTGNAAIPAWNYVYTGSGGIVKISVYISCYSAVAPITRSWSITKNGSPVCFGYFFFNVANTHTGMPVLMFVDKSYTTTPVTYGVSVGTGCCVDNNDYCSMTIAEY